MDWNMLHARFKASGASEALVTVPRFCKKCDGSADKVCGAKIKPLYSFDGRLLSINQPTNQILRNLRFEIRV